jgi:hypothetical protein
MRYVLFVFLLGLFDIARADELSEHLGVNSMFDQQYKELIIEAEALSKQLMDLQSKIGNQTNPDELNPKLLQQLQDYTGRFYNYRAKRTIMWTELYYELAEKLVLADLSNPALGYKATIETHYRAFREFVDQIKFYPEEKTTYKRWSGRSADVMDGLLRTSRELVDTVNTLNNHIRRKQGPLALPTRFILSTLDRINTIAIDVIFRRLEAKIRRGEDFFPSIERAVERKYQLLGFSFPKRRTFGAQPLYPGQFNIFLPPHGTPDEVAYIAAKIANNLPAGRRAAVIAAPYHFSENFSNGDPERGLSVGNALASHPSMIAVLGAQSTYRSSEIERRPLFEQMQEALSNGITDFILFPEGRTNGVDGGYTPVHPNAALAVIKLANGLTLKDSGKKLYATATIIGASLPNLNHRLGQDKSPMRLEEITTLYPEQLKRFIGKTELFGQMMEYQWHRYNLKHNPTRFGASASELELLRELQSSKHSPFHTLSCFTLSQAADVY